jgi:hypothetical protein
MRSVDLWILGRPSQPLTRKTNSCSRAEVPVPCIDIDAISVDPLGVAAIVLLVILGLPNQVITFVAGIPADPMQTCKSALNGNTDLCSALHCLTCLAASKGPYLPLQQIDKPIRDAPCLAVEQDALLPVLFQWSPTNKLPSCICLPKSPCDGPGGQIPRSAVTVWLWLDSVNAIGVERLPSSEMPAAEWLKPLPSI